MYHQVKSDLLKSSKHWKATMAPIRWQGGDKAPSIKRSLLCRLILNWPDPLTGTGTLIMRHTDDDSKTGPLNDHMERGLLWQKILNSQKYTYSFREQLKQVWMFLSI